jgi:hypothetical protein
METTLQINMEKIMNNQTVTPLPPECPPLGLRPRFIVEEQRLDEIEAAMGRYIFANMDIPFDWVDEFLYLLWRQKVNNQKRNNEHI